MALAKDYASVMGRSNDIMKKALGLDYANYESGSVAFDYEALMADTGYTLEEINKIQSKTAVGNTPLIELRNLTALSRKYAKPGYGARIFAKDEAANASGSFKARRAACAVAHAKKLGYKGVIAATSGNYGAAVASQAAMQGLKCIVVQECFDSNGVGQPEIVEKARACEAYGAEVIQLTVGPELFYTFLSVLEDTGYFNASLYSPFGIAGIETLGYEIAMQCRELLGKDPEMVVCTNAGGGMMTGTARGLIKAGAENTEVVAASIDPDHSDGPRSAARPLRYMDRYVTVTQGEVMYMTEALANLEGLERGPAGNTALAAAFSLAQDLPEDAVIVISETEYTGAGKHVQPQLSFARENGIDIHFGDPATEDKPGVNVILPMTPGHIKYKEADINRFRTSLIKKAIKAHCPDVTKLTDADLEFLAVEVKRDVDFVKEVIANL